MIGAAAAAAAAIRIQSMRNPALTHKQLKKNFFV